MRLGKVGTERKLGRGAFGNAVVFTAALTIVGFPSSVFAQQDPTSAVIQQLEQRIDEFRRGSRVEQAGDPVISDPLQRADLPEPGGPTITLSEIRFEPSSEFITDEELSEIAAAYVGRPIDFSEIAKLVRDINDIYAERGVVTASAILPPQDLSQNILTIQLVEGRLGNVAIVGDRVTNNQTILNRVRLVKGENGVVDVRTASEDITFSNRTSQLQMRMLLEPGATFGLTDIALGITEPPRNQFSAFIDNQGVRSTGEISGGLIWRHYGALGIDDSFLAFITGSEGSLAGTFTYDLPISNNGTRLAIGYTGSGTKVVDGPSVDLNVRGASHAGTATLTQALVARSDWLVQATVSGSFIYSESTISDIPLVETHTRRGVIGLPISHVGERHSAYFQPQVIFANVQNRLAPGYPEENFILFTGSAGVTYAFNESFAGTLRGSWQYTSADLLPGNLLFNIGGPTTVRGYPSEGVAGDSGYFVQAELGHRFSGKLQGLNVFAFSDMGEVFSTFPDRTTLFSAGLGLTYDLGQHATFELSAGVPLEDAVADQSSITLLARFTAKLN